VDEHHMQAVRTSRLLDQAEEAEGAGDLATALRRLASASAQIEAWRARLLAQTGAGATT
jgi:hypothetical protein